MANYIIESVCPHYVNNCKPHLAARYKGSSPSAVAKKVANHAAREFGLGVYYIVLRQTYQDRTQRYKVRVLRTTNRERDEAADKNLLFIPQRYARIEHKY